MLQTYIKKMKIYAIYLKKFTNQSVIAHLKP